MDSVRLPAHLETGAIRRKAESQGGFAMVLHKGDHDAGTILLVFNGMGTASRLWERMPTLEGSRKWTERNAQVFDNTQELNDFLALRQAQDPDLWILELTVADPERFVSELSSAG